MKKAIITGITGQDAAYLSQILLEKGYEVYGGYRRTSSLDLWRLKELGIENEIRFVPLDLLELGNIFRLIEKTNPDEIYNLAAQSFVGVSFDQPLLTAEIDALATTRILEAIRIYNPNIKFYQASTSEMFGKVQAIPQNEETPFYPRSPYGVAKLYAHWITINYREAYNIFASSGILFNHESPIRGEEFITRKITSSLARIHKGLQEYIEIGNLDSKRDWGYAKDYVDGMHRMLQQDKADDYVLATGKTYSVRQFIEWAAEIIGYEIIWEGKGLDELGIDKKTGKILIKVNPKFYRPTEVDLLVGDSTKARKVLGWNPKTSLKELISMMIEADLNRIG